MDTLYVHLPLSSQWRKVVSKDTWKRYHKTSDVWSSFSFICYYVLLSTKRPPPSVMSPSYPLSCTFNVGGYRPPLRPDGVGGRCGWIRTCGEKEWVVWGRCDRKNRQLRSSSKKGPPKHGGQGRCILWRRNLLVSSTSTKKDTKSRVEFTVK